MKRFRLPANFRWLRSTFLFAVFCTATGSLLSVPKSAPKKSDAKTAELPVAKTQRPPAADDLYEGPAVAKPLPPKPALPAENKIEATISPGPKYADAWPSEYRKAEADLQLTSESENRANAMAEFVRGQVASAKGEPDVALEAWKRASSLDPANADLAVKVAFELAKRNEPGEAIRILKDSIAAAPKEPKTHIYLSQIYEKNLNKHELAIAAALKATEVAPDYFPSWAAVYELHDGAGDKKKATDVMEKALKSPAKSAEYWLQFGGFLRKVFLKDDGTASPEELRQMETVFRKAVELKPDDASVLAQAGDFFALARNHKEALDFYARAVKLNQASRDEATRNLREKHIRALLANDRKAEAFPLLEQLSRDPATSMRNDLYEWLAELYEQAGQVDKALEQYKQTLVLDVSDPTNHLRLAYAQLRAKKFDDAVGTLTKARKKFPNRTEITAQLASALSSAKRHAEALAMFEKAAEEARGRNESILNASLFEMWAFAAERAGQFDKAVELLKKSIESNPDAPGAYNDLGYMWVERGLNLEEAGAFIKKAIELDGDNAAYLDSLGWYYFKTGKFEEAKRELLNALSKMKEEDATVLEHLGDTYEQLGNLREALNQWQRALKLEPENPDKLREKIEAAKKKQGA